MTIVQWILSCVFSDAKLPHLRLFWRNRSAILSYRVLFIWDTASSGLLVRWCSLVQDPCTVTALEQMTAAHATQEAGVKIEEKATKEVSLLNDSLLLVFSVANPGVFWVRPGCPSLICSNSFWRDSTRRLINFHFRVCCPKVRTKSDCAASYSKWIHRQGDLNFISLSLSLSLSLWFLTVCSCISTQFCLSKFSYLSLSLSVSLSLSLSLFFFFFFFCFRDQGKFTLRPVGMYMHAEAFC